MPHTLAHQGMPQKFVNIIRSLYYQTSGRCVQKACEENLVDLEYADGIVLMFEEEEKAQVFLDELTKVIPSFGMHFAPTKCKVMLVDVQLSNKSWLYGSEASVLNTHVMLSMMMI
ncbi:LOW QUALITY PROTEIN: hypothetical protein T265_14658 [Opisthorchis viverrini]|uniref:Reverse transcriptase domain-containing protein n=1 Tax=Opisthorchis viverrini TaxID=6198 RepID=A0A074ZCK9_OPIVI|nr:LOW QUALITY PROTEIN: hypothetical protein T265_14658 [Opisthorchis viverrini]KER23347.1 LOW QUALITY PROTEIN: hypothetical protein T265_14658 [Opisthorchis viverrini]